MTERADHSSITFNGFPAFVICVLIAGIAAFLLTRLGVENTSRISLVASQSVIELGGEVELTVVFRGHGMGVPGGEVRFVDESTGNVLGQMDAAAPMIRVSGLAAGSHRVRASYCGASDFLPEVFEASESAPIVLTVRQPSEINVALSPGADEPGQVVTMTATVRSRDGNPGGTVAFYNGDHLIAANVALARDGTATFTTSALAEGRRSIVAAYGGDATHGHAVSPRHDDEPRPTQ